MAYIDNNKIICYSDYKDQNKTYTYICDGHTITSYDKEVFVYHKKNIKIINFKEFGKNMYLFFVKEHKLQVQKLDIPGFKAGLSLFQGFDENTNQKYNFIPKLSQKKATYINTLLPKLDIDIKLQLTDKGWCTPAYIQSTTPTDISSQISFLFSLSLLYGQINYSNNTLKSAKIQLTFSGASINIFEDITNMIKNLTEQGFLFKIKTNTIQTSTILEININDYEILEAFAIFLNPIEKIEQITKSIYVNEARKKLIQLYPETTQLISNKIIKLLDQ